MTNPRMPCTTTATVARPRMMGARSLHPGGVGAVRCDGSVTFVPDSIDFTTWNAMGTAGWRNV